MKLYSFRFNKRTQGDIIEHLESQENKAGYIANLIRQDMIAQGKEIQVAQRVCDIIQDLKDTTTIVLRFKDGSKMVGYKENFINDKRYVDSYEREPTQIIIDVRYA